VALSSENSASPHHTSKALCRVTPRQTTPRTEPAQTAAAKELAQPSAATRWGALPIGRHRRKQVIADARPTAQSATTTKIRLFRKSPGPFRTSHRPGSRQG